jgi:predicted heme/steroid binding protein
MPSTQPDCVTNSRPVLFGYLMMLLIFVASAAVAAVTPGQTSDDARALRTLTAEELAVFDGKDGRPAYTAYDGIIYDVTASASWPDGEHYGQLAGKDLTGQLAGAPHGKEVLDRFPIVGQLAAPTDGVGAPSSVRRGQILILGKTLTAWTGYIFGIVFILNFMTCYVMPWCARSVPWKGKIPGPDKWDKSILKLSYYHRYWAWLTIIFGIIHGVLGIFQSFGIRI